MPVVVYILFCVMVYYVTDGRCLLLSCYM